MSAAGRQHVPLRRKAVIAASMLALLWVLAARLLGPSDLWDQTQPKTIAYTTDIIVNGRWVLPMERGEAPATKPPLYNWLAAPAVKLLGPASEAAHKLPSVAALCLCWLLLVRTGRAAFDDDRIGWLAGLCFVANYAVFKLGYLARPDMLLTLWLLIGWLAGTWLIIDARTERETRDRLPRAARVRLLLILWLSVGLAGLTKGPAAVTLVFYLLAAGPLLGGRWRALACLRWHWGLPLAAVTVGAWVIAVWRIDPAHLRDELWFNEVLGRITGLGDEGASEGPRELIISAPDMLIFYVMRFLPWSVFSIMAMASLWGRGERGAPRRWRTMGDAGALLHAAALFVTVIVVAYTLSAGKRADYIAAAYAPGALLAAWWLLRAAPRMTWLGPAGAAATLIVMTVFNQLQHRSPSREYGDEIMAFARQAEVVMRAEPRPVAFCWTFDTHIQAVLGYSQIDHNGRTGYEPLLDLIDRGRPLWIVVGRRDRQPQEFEEWLRKRRAELVITPVVRSAELPRAHSWPERMMLLAVEPGS
jgi:4-amino-4-deoxy-L-arabinose transferase-like glycosyltransferase